jgi:6-phosphogluconate dehydrogenase
MGANIVLNALDRGVAVVAYNRTGEVTREFAREAKSRNLTPAYSLSQMCAALPSPRVIWLMVTAGPAVDEIIKELLPNLKAGDTIIDGGNSFFKDSVHRNKFLKARGIHYLDCGTSGGLEGARNGACLMVGGDKRVFDKLEPLFSKIATSHGYMYCGPSGAGHYTKMVHNGIEYGLLQAFGEGYELLEKSPYSIDLEKTSRVWSHGSVVRGWMTELAERAFGKDAHLKKIRGVIGGGETGGWTLKTAKERKAEMPVLEASLAMRKRSAKKEVFAGKVIAALRNEFGGHAVVKAKKK